MYITIGDGSSSSSYIMSNLNDLLLASFGNLVTRGSSSGGGTGDGSACLSYMISCFSNTGIKADAGYQGNCFNI